jgi:hypothetical protein
VKIRIRFPQEDACAEANLLPDLAPKTCEAISSILPFHGTAHHGIYSGSECVLLLDRVLRLEPENARSKVHRGEIAFCWFSAGSQYGVLDDFAEICWFYDLDAEPRMWSGPVPVTVFARVQEPADAFYTVCRRMRREGVKPLTVEVVE